MDKIVFKRTIVTDKPKEICNRCKNSVNFLWEFEFIKDNPDHNFTEILCMDCTSKLLNKK